MYKYKFSIKDVLLSSFPIQPTPDEYFAIVKVLAEEGSIRFVASSVDSAGWEDYGLAYNDVLKVLTEPDSPGHVRVSQNLCKQVRRRLNAHGFQEWLWDGA